MTLYTDLKNAGESKEKAAAFEMVLIEINTIKTMASPKFDTIDDLLSSKGEKKGFHEDGVIHVWKAASRDVSSQLGWDDANGLDSDAEKKMAEMVRDHFKITTDREVLKGSRELAAIKYLSGHVRRAGLACANVAFNRGGIGCCRTAVQAGVKPRWGTEIDKPRRMAFKG